MTPGLYIIADHHEASDLVLMHISRPFRAGTCSRLSNLGGGLFQWLHFVNLVQAAVLSISSRLLVISSDFLNVSSQSFFS